MGFKSVYRVLMDVFPQVDTRILRAVAIENSKDADKAVEVVLIEVIPVIAISDSTNNSLDNATCDENIVLRSSTNNSADNASREENTVHSSSNYFDETVKLLKVSSRDDVKSNGDPVCISDGNSSDINTSAMKLSSIKNEIQQVNDVSEASQEIYISDEIEEKSTHEIVDFEQAAMEVISTRELVEAEDENAFDTKISQSGQLCRIDLLEDIVNEARDNKKTMFSAVESVIGLMREVEVRERAAEQAEEEAARGPLDILTSLEDLKLMLIQAREANDMHAGEAYGEKAILATEAKELQSRLLYLSDERDKSLAILDEMRKTLEDRLDAAEKALKAAEQEKMEKEERARKALTEQQLVMDKLVKESNMLKQETEENTKLQEFLMDRGSVVDILQGEISVICQDIKLLKQKFDERVPLSESLSSSQTSCRLASSSSSLKSLPLDQDLLQIETKIETPKKGSPTPSISDHLSLGEEREANDRDALVDDDGWELCDNKELNI